MVTTSEKQEVTLELPRHNWDAIHQLRQEKELCENGFFTATGLGAAGAMISGPIVALPFFALAYPSTIRATKIFRLEKLTTLLVENFEAEGIQVFPTHVVDVKTTLDLFVRFPGKSHIFISIRSQGDNEVVYNEAREILQISRKNKPGLKTWKPCPLIELASYERWLNKNRGLFGMSSREATKTSTAKVLVLWSPTKAKAHKEHLYSKFSGEEFLALRRKGTSFVIQDDEITKFVTAWLSRCETV